MLKFSFFIESEICDRKLIEARHNYSKRALKTLFNGSQKTFQVQKNTYKISFNLLNNNGFIFVLYIFFILPGLA